MTAAPSSRRTLLAVIALSALAAATAHAQVTQADYERARGLRDKYEAAAAGIAGPATWIDKTSRFWFRRSVAGGHEFVLADAATTQARPAFDHARLAGVLSTMTGRTVSPTAFPFNSISFANDEQVLDIRFDGHDWACSLDDYSCKRTPVVSQWERQQPPPPCTPPAPDAKRKSPDGKTEAVILNFNIAIREVGSAKAVPLTTDGSEGNCYELGTVVWSPDSTRLAAYRTRPGHRRLVHYVESSPEDQLQPKHSTRFYAKPGDALDLDEPVIVEVATKRSVTIANTLFPNAYELSPLVWRKDSRTLTFEYNQRGHEVYRVIEADVRTGAARALIAEEPKTFFAYSGKKYRFDLDDGKEIVWMSERDGWNHLYLVDGVTGKVKHPITKGPWVVRGVSKVDEQTRQVYFSASGIHPGRDPYFVHYYRIGLDGTGLTPLTETDATHQVSFSSDMAFYADLHSRVDAPPVLDVRRTADRSLVFEAARGDLTALRKAGWAPPEVFVAKGRDGTTDIWGVIYRPTAFDPAKRYPVIENIYAGPHSSFVPKAFGAFNAMQAQAELGFIVVQVDGMGTSNRSKAFHDVAWMNLKDAGFPDRILWHQAVAARYPWYDISRVGIYGTSAGGQNSMGALLFHPEFYKAAVSAVGCHDNRMDKIWWNEQWMGWPIGPQYAASSNVDHAHRLQGKLLLVVGELDTNVDPSSTMQVVNALIKANKDFELLVIPGAGHGAGGAYGERRRFDFFVRHLKGLAPPDWNGTPAAAR